MVQRERRSQAEARLEYWVNQLDKVTRMLAVLTQRADQDSQAEIDKLKYELASINDEIEGYHSELSVISFKQLILEHVFEEHDESGLSWLRLNVLKMGTTLTEHGEMLDRRAMEMWGKQLDFVYRELKRVAYGKLLHEDPIFEVRSPFKNENLARDVLSFGQKSTILTELWLGCFETMSKTEWDFFGGRGTYSLEDSVKSEAIKNRPWQGASVENRYCLIIDEPEVGRSEYSVNKLISRLEESKELMDDLGNNTILVLSHRNKLLTQVSGQYHLLQPVDLEFQSEEE
tara:strand:- start:847 stop:1707 length:861 start_codon:yes stop_codon:yes gene_type:complete